MKPTTGWFRTMTITPSGYSASSLLSCLQSWLLPSQGWITEPRHLLLEVCTGLRYGRPRQDGLRLRLSAVSDQTMMLLKNAQTDRSEMLGPGVSAPPLIQSARLRWRAGERRELGEHAAPIARFRLLPHRAAAGKLLLVHLEPAAAGSDPATGPVNLIGSGSKPCRCSSRPPRHCGTQRHGRQD